MKFKLTTITVFISMMGLYSCSFTNDEQRLSYDEIKTGQFVIKGLDRTIMIERDDDSQIEYEVGGFNRMQYNLRWKTKDQYILTYIHGNDPCLKVGDEIIYNITRRTINGYYFSTDGGTCKQSFIGELIKV